MPRLPRTRAKSLRTIREAARDGQLMVLRCHLCSRAAHYLASDLVKVLDPRWPTHVPPWPCSRCGSNEAVSVKWRNPHPGDIGVLPIRRPGPYVLTWRTVKLGEDARGRRES